MERVLAENTVDRVGQTVSMIGWVQTIRRHAKVAFIDLRDRSGLTQLVFTGQLLDQVDAISPESVVEIEGKVNERPKSLVNSNLITGTIEVEVSKISLISAAQTLPFTPGDVNVNEQTRLQHRYLDLRASRLNHNLKMRQQVNQFFRDQLMNRGFTEVETPILSRSTPEGARDFLVPSRVEPGSFYALPQSPQQYKQLLMVAGLERYFQIARCFRDEDSRGDRQPEFTQLDVELSFTNEEEVMDLICQVYLDLAAKLFPEKVVTNKTVTRLTYAEAMAKYGTDSPDLRQDKDNPDELAFALVTDFPLFEWKESEKRFDATHHPFTKPKDEFVDSFETRPKEALACQYDLVLNGTEIAGGSIRIHQPEVLMRIFQFLGHSKEQVKNKFGHLLEAFSYGVPPHGGFACGLDRLLMILLKEPSIRETIAFPKSGDGHDWLMDSPNTVDQAQLDELTLKLKQ